MGQGRYSCRASHFRAAFRSERGERRAHQTFPCSRWRASRSAVPGTASGPPAADTGRTGARFRPPGGAYRRRRTAGPRPRSSARWSGRPGRTAGTGNDPGKPAAQHLRQVRSKLRVSLSAAGRAHTLHRTGDSPSGSFDGRSSGSGRTDGVSLGERTTRDYI